ncbi:glycosyltransferase [Duganella sp. FT92W]|uniref:Glycosyltransferase n=2 Tax=Pseudoduganella rivuli TaxID=2666085 RepID=A0A7X2IKD0_9BURK|nr:glycosyltransferase [Pseudoduganella rivuli]
MKMETLPAPRKTRAKAVKAAPGSDKRWTGALEGMHRGLVYGWVLDIKQPEQRVVLEVLRDGDAIGTVTADIARGDLADTFASVLPAGTVTDVCHGFIADLGIIKPGHQGVVTMRIANTDALLPGHVELASSTKPPVAARSAVFSDGALRLHGWAIDNRDERRKVTVRAYEGEQLLAETLADITHPATRAYEVNDHGFILNLPIKLGDGLSHTVRVVDDRGNQLNGSPLTVCCYAQGVKALLPDDTGVLGSAIDGYERVLPRSLAMHHYREWHAQFETPGSVPPLPDALAALKVGILVHGGQQGDQAAAARTLASLQQQSHPLTHVFALEPGVPDQQRALHAMLQAALIARCDIIACVRNGDTLAPHAVTAALHGFADAATQLVYTDSERAGRPWFKPAWNPEYALASDYPLDLVFARAPAVAALPVETRANAALLVWSLLAAQWEAAQQTVVHVPRVLLQSDTPLSAQEQQQRYEAATTVLGQVDTKAALQPLAGPGDAGFIPRRIVRALGKRDRQRSVSLIIPTRDHVELLERCISTIQQHTKWENLEIIVIDNDSALPKTKAYFRKISKQGVRILPAPGPFNFATLNNAAVDAATGEIVGLINNDIEAMHDGWLEEIVSHLLQPGVGAVGAKLLWPNGMVQHGGVLMGVGNVAGHFGNRLAERDWGDHGRNQLLQQVSGVTAACLFLRKSDYLAVGGMNGVAFPVAFNDVDLCLKLRTAGKSIIWTPYATMLHAESASRGTDDSPQKSLRAQREIDQLRTSWGYLLQHDPAYHPSLNLDAYSHAFGGLALPPRDRAPRQAGFPVQVQDSVL